MRVSESFTSPPIRRVSPQRDAARFGPSAAFALALTLVISAVVPNVHADERRLRGDLPPVAGRLPIAEFDELSPAQAKALFEEVHRLLSQRLDSERSRADDLYLGAIQGMLAQVNAAHESRSGGQAGVPQGLGMLLSSAQAQQIRQTLTGQVIGIGIEFQLLSTRGVLLISRILPGSPAEASGLKADDQILSIDGQALTGASLADVLSLLQGEAEAPVSFEFLRATPMGVARYVMQLNRGAFSLQSSEAHLEPGGIGYLKLHQLHLRSPTEVEAQLAELQQQGARRFILDLRGCVGGELEAARALADLFLPPGTVIAVATEPGLGSEDLRAQTQQRFPQGLAILIDRWTRGSAELLAASLQEQDRAFLIGEPTLGHARGETLIELGHSLVLRLESVLLSGAMGSSWGGEGVQPDQPIWSTSAAGNRATDHAGDLQFQTAIHYLTHDAAP